MMKKLAPRVQSAGSSCRITPPDAPCPGALPVMRPGLYSIVVPVYENSMCEPFVMDSSRRRKDTSCGARPGDVCDDALICDIRMGLPVRVAKTRRWMRYFDPVNLRGGAVCAVVIFADSFTITFISGLYIFPPSLCCSRFRVLEV